jgi:hypothetical protein
MLDVQKLKGKLELIAKQVSWADNPDCSPADYCGENIDDVFSGGREAGEIDLARELLNEFFGENLPLAHKRPED